MNGELRWRSSSEVDGSDRLTFQIVLAQSQFFAEGINQFPPVSFVGGRIEITVVTAAGAEGNVNVEGGHDIFAFRKFTNKDDSNN